MTSHDDAAARSAVADQITAGATRGTTPGPWAASFSFDPRAADETIRIDGIARSLREGLMGGADWNVAIARADGSLIESAVGVDEARQALADDAWLQYDFGTDAVGDSEGWERTTPGDEWTRRVYLESDEADVDDATQAATLNIRFEPDTAFPAEIYAIDEDGNVFGSIDLATRAVL